MWKLNNTHVQQMGQRKKSKGKSKNIWKQMKMNAQRWNAAKAHLREKFIEINAYFKKKKKDLK